MFIILKTTTKKIYKTTRRVYKISVQSIKDIGFKIYLQDCSSHTYIHTYTHCKLNKILVTTPQSQTPTKSNDGSGAASLAPVSSLQQSHLQQRTVQVSEAKVRELLTLYTYFT